MRDFRWRSETGKKYFAYDGIFFNKNYLQLYVACHLLACRHVATISFFLCALVKFCSPMCNEIPKNKKEKKKDDIQALALMNILQHFRGHIYQEHIFSVGIKMKFNINQQRLTIEDNNRNCACILYLYISRF